MNSKIDMQTIIQLMDKVPNNEEREWYIEKIIQNGWSRAVLIHQLSTKLYNRQGTSTKVNTSKSN